MVNYSSVFSIEHVSDVSSSDIKGWFEVRDHFLWVATEFCLSGTCLHLFSIRQHGLWWLVSSYLGLFKNMAEAFHLTNLWEDLKESGGNGAVKFNFRITASCQPLQGGWALQLSQVSLIIYGLLPEIFIRNGDMKWKFWLEGIKVILKYQQGDFPYQVPHPAKLLDCCVYRKQKVKAVHTPMRCLFFGKPCHSNDCFRCVLKS